MHGQDPIHIDLGGCVNNENSFIGYFLAFILVNKQDIFGFGSPDLNLHFTLLFSLAMFESSIFCSVHLWHRGRRCLDAVYFYVVLNCINSLNIVHVQDCLSCIWNLHNF